MGHEVSLITQGFITQAIIFILAVCGIYFLLKKVTAFLFSKKYLFSNKYQTSTLRPSDQRLKDYTRYLLDKIPLPAWVRSGKDLTLLYCNASYAAALDTSQQDAVENNIPLRNMENTTRMARRALESDTAQSESHTVVLHGKRKLMEFNEIPLVDGSAIVGYAVDHSILEGLQHELERHNIAHQNILGYLNNAIVIYDTNKNLQFYNKAFQKLWGLEIEFLDNEPKFEDVLEELRTHRRIPEQADFPSYKRDMANYFRTLLAPRQEILHLPDERIIRQTILPHPLSGLIFIHENITDNIALQRQNTVLSETFEASLNAIAHPVLLINADSQLSFVNNASIAWSGVSLQDYAKQKLSIKKVLELLPEGKKPDSIDTVLSSLQYKEPLQKNYIAAQKIQFKCQNIPYGNTIMQLVLPQDQ